MTDAKGMKIKIKTDNIVGDIPLYTRYQGQLRPQSAYIWMNEDGEVWADYEGGINSMPITVWSGRTLRWQVPEDVKSSALLDFLKDEKVIELLGRIHAGHKVFWDEGDYFGSLNDDAAEASEELEKLIEENLVEREDARFSVFSDPNEWITESINEIWKEGEALKDIAEEIVENSYYYHSVIFEGGVEAVEEALLNKVFNAFVDRRCPEERLSLNITHLDALLDAEKIDKDDYQKWLDEMLENNKIDQEVYQRWVAHLQEKVLQLSERETQDDTDQSLTDSP